MMNEKSVQFRVHTPNLLAQVLDNPGTAVLKIPLIILLRLLGRVAERAIELDDPIMNELMMRLTMYSAADPGSPDYSEELVKKILGK